MIIAGAWLKHFDKTITKMFSIFQSERRQSEMHWGDKAANIKWNTQNPVVQKNYTSPTEWIKKKKKSGPLFFFF